MMMMMITILMITIIINKSKQVVMVRKHTKEPTKPAEPFLTINRTS
jgi:hypothetical protein